MQFQSFPLIAQNTPLQLGRSGHNTSSYVCQRVGATYNTVSSYSIMSVNLSARSLFKGTIKGDVAIHMIMMPLCRINRGFLEELLQKIGPNVPKLFIEVGNNMNRQRRAKIFGFYKSKDFHRSLII